MIQIAVLKISDYGPWTLTLGSDREHRLQMLQASLHKEIQDQFSTRNCSVFPNRFDELFAVSNGLKSDDYARIQKHLQDTFDLRLSISVGCDATPLEANRRAHEARTNSAEMVPDMQIYGSITEEGQTVSIMHIDVEDLTSQTKTLSPYEISSSIFGLYSRMSDFFMQYGALTFFMGGDNFMVVTTQNEDESARKFIDDTKNDGIILNCGIGTAATSREAVSLATKSLDRIREIRDSGGDKPQVLRA